MINIFDELGINYDIKMIKIYIKKAIDWIRTLKWNIWQLINRKLLKTYHLIFDRARCEDCGQNVHDFWAPDDLWFEATNDFDKILCYDCFCNRLDAKHKGKRMKIGLVEWD